MSGVLESPSSFKFNKNCKKSLLPLFSFPSTSFFTRSPIIFSNIPSKRGTKAFISFTTPCKSNRANPGKKSDKFGFPKSYTISATASLNSTPKLSLSSPSNDAPHVIFVITFNTVKNACSPTFILDPTRV